MVFLKSLYYVLSISSRSLFLMMMMMLMMNLVVFAAGGPTGFSLKLIHRDSPESPLYPGNLTQLERMDRDFQQSIARERQLTTWMKSSWVSSRNNNNSSTTNTKSLDMLRPQVSLYSGLYLVRIGLGTFANGYPMLYFLFIDTGSDLLWVQCKGNNDKRGYFHQDAPLFDGESSRTFEPFPIGSTHPFCQEYGNLKIANCCGYRIRYADGASSQGVLATERLTVNADNGGLEGIDNFVFGCGLKQNNPSFGKGGQGNNPIAGIFGLGGGASSFARQKGDQIDNKFEYCFKPWYDDANPGAPTFIRFGTDTKIVVDGQGVQTTSLVPVRGDTVYYMDMEGISIDGERVVYPEGSNVFEARPDGNGGCIIDSGCAVTHLSTPVYDPFKDHLIAFFNQKHQIRTYDKPVSPYELCFVRPNGFDQFPAVTFHYSGANFDIEPISVFKVAETLFCLTFVRSKSVNSYSVILGVRNQVNHRILHDLKTKKISWVYEKCSVLG